MRIAIAGAGIAGLTSALALSGQGHEITLYEKRTGFRETGAGIQLSPNATRALSGLRLDGALARTACEPELMRIRALRSGREIGRVALGGHMRERFGSPYLAIARADLHTALLDAVRARADIRLRIGRALTRITETADAVRLTLVSEAGGEQEALAEALIGADGLRSAVRTALGIGRAPRYAGYAACRAVIPAGAVPEGITAGEVGLWLGPGRHVVHYPIAGGRLVNLVVVARRAGELAGWSADHEAARVRSDLADAAPPLRHLVGAAGTWAAWSLYEMPVAAMAEGRVALVGDAAHPVLPYLAQGGGLAIEDAVALAAELRRPDGGPADALRRYGRARLGRARSVQTAAARNGLAYHAGGPVALIRDVALRRLGPHGISERYAWLYGWRPE